MLCILYQVYKHLSANWFPISFSLWARHKSARCLNGDQALTSFFLNNHSSSGRLSLKHTPDFPIPASWLWLYWLLVTTNWCNYRLPRQWIKQVSPNMAAVYLRWFWGNTGDSGRIHSIQSEIDTQFTTQVSQLFSMKILYSVGMFDFFAFSWILHYSCGYQELNNRSLKQNLKLLDVN